MRQLTSLALIGVVLSIPVYGQSGFEFTLKRNSKTEQQTRDQLERLLRSYDISQWIFTKSILIDDNEIPHSHPVLTMSTRHIKDDDLSPGDVCP
jgi:hypothetical protein